MILAARNGTVRPTSWSSIPSIAASAAGRFSTWTCPTLPWLGQVTHTRWCPPRSEPWSRTGSHTGWRPGTSGGTIEFSSPSPPSKTGWRRRGKKAADNFEEEHLPWALLDFSGYVAADELYDGPFCILSIVDNHSFRRIVHEVLDHDPTKDDIRRFLQRFKDALDAQGLTLHGITTDGSQLYPEPIQTVFGAVRHQICKFHVIAELTKAVLKAVAKVRRSLKAKMPKLPRGKPASPEARRSAAQKKRLQNRVSDLFDSRYLFVQRQLTLVEREKLVKISWGLPELQTLRGIMDQVYRLFDRRCRTETALAKLGRLRQQVRRFKGVGKALQKIFSPNLEKALTFLDDSMLPATSNAVERGNRRHRKMQKSVYRVRTRKTLVCRLALDHARDRFTSDHVLTVAALHSVRAGRLYSQEDATTASSAVCLAKHVQNARAG